LPVALICDALKIAYVTQGREQYKDVFDLVSHVRRGWTRQIRLGDALHVGAIHPYLRRLKSYWDRKA